MNTSKINSLRIEDRDLEKSILGAMLQFNDAAEYAIAHLRDSDFAVVFHRVIYKAVKMMYESTGAIDWITINDKIQSTQELKENTPKDIEPTLYLMECTNSVRTSACLPEWCRLLKDIAERRRIWFLTGSVAANIKEGYMTPPQLWKQIEDALAEQAENGCNDVHTLAQVLGSVISGTSQQPIKTGFQYLDDKGGFSEGDLVIIAAETSQGKTSLALDICMNTARNGYQVVFYSAEMRAEQLAARMLSMTSNVNSNSILRNDLTDEQIVATNKGIAQLEKLPICFDDKASIDIDTIIGSIRRANKQRNAKIFFIDYLQVLQFNERLLKQTEESFFGSVARRLKNIAKELNVCVILLSQLSRSESREPSLSRLRGSGQIAEAADVVITIYRPEEYGKTYSGSFSNIDTRGTALIKMEKGRNTGTGAFICGFDAAKTHFYDIGQTPIRATAACYTPFADCK